MSQPREVALWWDCPIVRKEISASEAGSAGSRTDSAGVYRDSLEDFSIRGSALVEHF